MPNQAGALKETSPDASSVASELERIAASKSFRKAERCLRLLRYLTSSVLDGRGDELKEYSVGLAVFERPESYDPGTDPIVRLEARRLRLKLAEYYQQEGIGDPVIIDVPKGAYVPAFQFRRPPETEVEREPIREPEAAAPRGMHRILWIAVGAVTLLILVLAVSWSVFAKRPPALQMRASVAVMGFQDLSPRSEGSWVSTAVSELMNIDLGSGQQLRALPLENVARTRKELALAPQSSYPAQALQRIRTDLGSDYVVGGSYLPQGHVIHLNVMLFDARSGQQVAAISEQGTDDGLPALIERCAQRVQAQLGVRFSTTETSSFEDGAMEPYARGMEQLRNGDAQSARVYLEQAAAAAARQSSGACRTGGGMVRPRSGYSRRSGSQARVRFIGGARDGWSNSKLRGATAPSRRTGHGPSRCIRRCSRFCPTISNTVCSWRRRRPRAGEAQDALNTVKALRRLPSPAGDDPRIDLAEARAAGALSDFERTRRMAHSAADKAKAHGARLQYARARLLESGAMQTLAPAGFAEVRTEARQICAELGDLACVAAAYRIEANATLAYGNLAGARVLYESALGIANQIGNALEKLNALDGIADAAKLQGDLSAAESSYKTALTVSSEMGPQKSYSRNAGPRGRAGGRRAPPGGANAGSACPRYCEADRRAAGRCAEPGEHREYAGPGREELRSGERIRRGNRHPARGERRVLPGPGSARRGKCSVGRGQPRRSPRGFRGSRYARSPSSGLAGFGSRHGFRAACIRGRPRRGGGAPRAPGAERIYHFRRQGDRFEATAVLVRALIAQHEIPQASQALAQLPSPDGQKLPARNIVPFEIARCFLLANTGKREEALREIDAVSANAASSGLPILAKEAQQAKKALAKAGG